MANPRTVRIQQPAIEGRLWPSLGPLPLSDRDYEEFRGTFSADAIIYRPTTESSFTADASLRAKVVEDTFTRSLTGEYGTPDLGNIASFDLENELLMSVDGSELVIPSGEGELDLFIGPSTDVGDFYFDFKAVEDEYIFIAPPAYKREDGNQLTYWASVDLWEEAGAWTVAVDFPGEFIDLPFIVNGDWYRVRLNYNTPQRTAKIKIWDRDDPEPSTWTSERTLVQRNIFTQGQQFNLYVGWQSTGAAADDKRIDNIQLYSQGMHNRNFFTARALILRQISGSFTADAVIGSTAGTLEYTFTADAFIIADTKLGSFTADSLLKKIVAGTFTADSRLVNRISNTFTADAWILNSVTQSFKASAYIYRPQDQGTLRLTKRTTLTVLQHREKPLPTYVPPRIPDQEDLPEDNLGGPPCLPPCPGAGAGFGTGFGINGGAILQTITQCTNGTCGLSFYNSGDNWIGKGPLAFATHCGCETSHSQSSHVNRMWITYSTVPSVKFRMRAKMVWELGSPSTVTVKVFAAASAPSLELDDCDTSASYWDSGLFVGQMTFVADGSGSIGGRDVWFQEEPSELVIDPGSISGNTFRFELADEGTNYRAEFKASNTQIVTD